MKITVYLANLQKGVSTLTTETDLYKCWLHPDILGEHVEMVICDKDNLPTEMAVKYHMLARHPKEWEIIKMNRLQEILEWLRGDRFHPSSIML